ncbi:DUF732 domain-containing protein [Mycobacterium xenopi]
MMFRTLTLTSGLAVAAVCLAVPASADHAGYLARLDRNHVSYVSQPDAVHWGSSVCDELRNGADVPAVVSTLKNNGGFTTRDAGAIIGAATSELCPDQHQTAMQWAYGQTGS